MVGITSSRERSRDVSTHHESFLRHRNFRYLKAALLLCAAAIAGYALVDAEPRRNGGSWYGYLLGTIGALLIVWLALIGIRKRAITAGRWSLKAWTSAHVYLGLSLLVIGTLHGGFQFGWNVHTLAYALMVLVILSGLYGIQAYAVLPRQMSDNRQSTGQQEMLGELNALDRQIREAASSLGESYVAEVERATGQTRLVRNLAVRLSGRDRKCATTRALEAMRGIASKEPRGAPPAVGEVMALLERKATLLARARRHIRYRARLEIWLVVHVPATFALLAALTAHIVSVFYYW